MVSNTILTVSHSRISGLCWFFFNSCSNSQVLSKYLRPWLTSRVDTAFLWRTCSAQADILYMANGDTYTKPLTSSLVIPYKHLGGTGISGFNTKAMMSNSTATVFYSNGWRPERNNQCTSPRATKPSSLQRLRHARLCFHLLLHCTANPTLTSSLRLSLALTSVDILEIKRSQGEKKKDHNRRGNKWQRSRLQQKWKSRVDKD